VASQPPSTPRPHRTGQISAKWYARWRSVRLIFAYGGGLLIAVGAGYAFPVQAFDRHYSHVTAGWLVVVIGLLAIGFFAVVEIFSSNPVPDKSPDEVPEHRLFAESPIKDIAVASSVEMVLRPRVFFREITEAVRPETSYYTRTATLVMELPASGAGETHLVPVMTHPRGQQIDDIAVNDENGTLIPILSDLESRGALTALIDSYAKTVVDTNDPTVQVVLQRVRDAVRADGPLPGSAIEEGGADLFSRDDVVALPRLAGRDDVASAKDIQQLGELCEWAVRNHALVVPIPGGPSRRITLDVRYRHAEPFPATGITHWLRNFLGLQPYLHRLRLPQSVRAASYNLIFHCPAGQYVYACSVASPAASKRSVAVSATRGWGALDYASVKIRPVAPGSPDPSGEPSVFLDVRERPPGLLGVVALVGTAQFALIWVFGIFHDSFFPTAGGAGTTRCVMNLAGRAGRGIVSGGSSRIPIDCHAAAHFDVATILLALPALLAGWVAARFAREQIQWTSLAPILGMMLTGVIAIVSTALALWESSGHDLNDAVWVVEHPAWAALMVVSALLTVDMLVRVTTRSLRFRRRLARAAVIERYRV
jgi:hypothetical protein